MFRLRYQVATRQMYLAQIMPPPFVPLNPTTQGIGNQLSINAVSTTAIILINFRANDPWLYPPPDPLLLPNIKSQPISNPNQYQIQTNIKSQPTSNPNPYANQQQPQPPTATSNATTAAYTIPCSSISRSAIPNRESSHYC